MKRKSTNSVSSFLSSVVILLVVVAVVGFLFYFTNNFTTELKGFYVKCGDETFIDDCQNFDIILNKEYKFDVVNTYNKKSSSYTVSIIPNETSTTTFMFNVDETEINYADVESLAKGFSVNVYEDYFIFSASMDLLEILQLYYPLQTITNVPTAIDTELPYFRLTISTSDMAEEININFNLKSE